MVVEHERSPRVNEMSDLKTKIVGGVLLAMIASGCKPTCSDGSEADDACVCKDGSKAADCTPDVTGGTGGGATTPTQGDADLPTDCVDLGPLHGSQTISGSVSDFSDEQDYYCFEVDSLSALTVQFGTGYGSEAELYEYKDAVAAGELVGTTFNHSGSWDILPKRYLLKVVVPGFGGGDYEIALNLEGYDLTEPDPDPGRTSDEATSLSPDDTLTWTSGYVGKQDTEDLYAVDVPEGKILGVQVDHVGMTGTVEVSVVPFAPSPMFGAPLLSGGPGLHQLDKPIDEGSYLMRVSGAGVYRLGLNLSPAE